MNVDKKGQPMSSIYYKNQKYTGPTLDLGSGSLTTDNKTIVGAINELDAGKVGTTMSSRDVYFTSSATFSYTGVSIPIKANTPYILVVMLVWGNGAPLEIALRTSETETHVVYTLTRGECGQACWCGYSAADTEIYVWARYNNASQNIVRYRLVYFE